MHIYKTSQDKTSQGQNFPRDKTSQGTRRPWDKTSQGTKAIKTIYYAPFKRPLKFII